MPVRSWIQWLEPPGSGEVFRRLLAMLLLTDAILIVIHFGLLTRGPGSSAVLHVVRDDWLIGTDRSFPELFQYTKWAGISGLLVLCAWRNKASAFAWMAVIFVILLLDDSLMLHERGGGVLARYLDLRPALGLRPQDRGELIVWSGLGAIAVSCAVIAHTTLRPGETVVAQRLAVTLAGLVAVGVGVDMLHSMVIENLSAGSGRNMVHRVMELVEDGGEMALASLAVAYAGAAYLGGHD
jgi:hypothetical protein